MMKVWYNWPKGYYEKNWRPLYAIAWNLLWAIPLYASATLFATVCILSGNTWAAKEVWRML